MRRLLLTASALLLLSQGAFAQQNGDQKEDFNVVKTLETEKKIDADFDATNKRADRALKLRDEILREIALIKVRAEKIKDILNNLDCHAAKKAISNIDFEIESATKRRDNLLTDPLCTGEMGEGQQRECRKISEDFEAERSKLEAMKAKIASNCSAGKIQ